MRFRMLETLREYGASVCPSDERDAAPGRGARLPCKPSRHRVRGTAAAAPARGRADVRRRTFGVDPGVFGGQIIYNPPPLGRTADPLPPTDAGADVAS